MAEQTIDKKWYRPRQIARLGLIKNSVDSDKENSNYEYILKLIRTGQLKARNYSIGDSPRWLISQDEIDRFRAQLNEG